MLRNESGQLEAGTVLAGRYRITRFLAGGGMGLVYVAQDQRLAGRRCAMTIAIERIVVGYWNATRNIGIVVVAD